MSAATTILFARKDLSIPGGAGVGIPGNDRRDSVQANFFDLISRSSPDVIVLDFSRAPAAGTNTILTVRRRTDVPIYWWCAVLNNQKWRITALPAQRIVLPRRSTSSA
jgi:hypothetical protein